MSARAVEQVDYSLLGELRFGKKADCRAVREEIVQIFFDVGGDEHHVTGQSRHGGQSFYHVEAIFLAELDVNKNHRWSLFLSTFKCFIPSGRRGRNHSLLLQKSTGRGEEVHIVIDDKNAHRDIEVFHDPLASLHGC